MNWISSQVANISLCARIHVLYINDPFRRKNLLHKSRCRLIPFFYLVLKFVFGILLIIPICSHRHIHCHRHLIVLSIINLCVRNWDVLPLCWGIKVPLKNVCVVIACLRYPRTFYWREDVIQHSALIVYCGISCLPFNSFCWWCSSIKVSYSIPARLYFETNSLNW